jgi:hypothetical protein
MTAVGTNSRKITVLFPFHDGYKRRFPENNGIFSIYERDRSRANILRIFSIYRREGGRGEQTLSPVRPSIPSLPQHPHWLSGIVSNAIALLERDGLLLPFAPYRVY